MLVKVLVIVVLLVVAFSLFSALHSMVRNQDGDKERMVKMLGYRVAFSVVLLILLGIAYGMGWIQPHGLRG